jgi:alkyl hydroperoxide reductase subunit AhpC
MQIGQIAPDFEQDTANGSIRFHEWIAGSWSVLFSHMGGAARVSLKEIAEVARLKAQWDHRGVKPVALSIATSDMHHRWEHDIEGMHGCPVNFPMVADCDRSVSLLYGMLHDPAAGSLTTHHVFIIDDKKRVRSVLAYPPTIERNFHEILRIVDALRLADARSATRVVNRWGAGMPTVAPDHFDTLSVIALRRHRAQVGAVLARKTWGDDALRQRILVDATAVFETETGRRLPPGLKLRVVEDDASTLHIVVPAKPASAHELSDAALEAVSGGAGRATTYSAANRATVSWTRIPVLGKPEPW